MKFLVIWEKKKPFFWGKKINDGHEFSSSLDPFLFIKRYKEKFELELFSVSRTPIRGKRDLS